MKKKEIVEQMQKEGYGLLDCTEEEEDREVVLRKREDLGVYEVEEATEYGGFDTVYSVGGEYVSLCTTFPELAKEVGDVEGLFVPKSFAKERREK